MAKAAKPAGDNEPNNALRVQKRDNEGTGLATARTILGPDFRHAVTTSQVLKPQFGKMDGAPGFGDYADAIRLQGDGATKGEIDFASRTLAAQAMTLDTIFTEMARRMALNMTEYLGATETYARIALKAQAQSRATLEVIAKLHQPREQTVRHVHVNEGGQAVIADQFHNYGGTGKYGQMQAQSHAKGACSATLFSQDPVGNGVPIPGSGGEAAMQDARRDKSGRA